MRVTPSARAAVNACAISRSYTSFEHGQGMRTFLHGSATASAWRSSNSSRTACIETLEKSVVTVVRRPTTSTSPASRSTCSAHELSFPLLHATQAFGRDGRSRSSVATLALDDTIDQEVVEAKVAFRV